MFFTFQSVHSFRNSRKWVKKHQCINWRSITSRWRWRERRWRGKLSVTICRWRSHQWGLGFWFWAVRIVSAGEFSLDVRSCPGWGCPALAACLASCTGPPSCQTPWRRSCGSRSGWWWPHFFPPHYGSPRLSAKCFPGSRPRHIDRRAVKNWLWAEASVTDDMCSRRQAAGPPSPSSWQITAGKQGAAFKTSFPVPKLNYFSQISSRLDWMAQHSSHDHYCFPHKNK